MKKAKWQKAMEEEDTVEVIATVINPSDDLSSSL
jgi:hypothetical protein